MCMAVTVEMDVATMILTTFKGEEEAAGSSPFVLSTVTLIAGALVSRVEVELELEEEGFLRIQPFVIPASLRLLLPLLQPILLRLVHRVIVLRRQLLPPHPPSPTPRLILRHLPLLSRLSHLLIPLSLPIPRFTRPHPPIHQPLHILLRQPIPLPSL